MKVSIIGSGYVGTTLAACLAELGHDVTAIDIDKKIVDSINAGQSPIHEPRLEELLSEHVDNHLVATTDYDSIRESDVIFLALTTPSHSDGSIDLSIIKAAAETVGQTLAETDGGYLVVTKSTVIPGTTDEVLSPLLAEASGKKIGDDLYVAVNPEFLREGSAVSDFMNPDKIVFGAEDNIAFSQLRKIYQPLLDVNDSISIVETGLREAEMIKYSNNAFLAAKVSLINELGNICKEYNVDTYEVAEALGFDERISEKFLRSGLGWGGSCFPKDIAALSAAAGKKGYNPGILEAVTEVNNKQPQRMLNLLRKHISLSGKRIAVLGLAFKPGTDDIRNSQSIPIIDGLLKADADVVAYDPAATENMRAHFPNIEYTESAETALNGAHGALVATDWDELTVIDEEFEAMAQKVIVDGRHIDLPVESRELTYEGLCW